MTRPRVRARVLTASTAAIAVLIVLLCCPPSALAQFASIAPPFTKMTGGYLWGSLGYRDASRPERFDMSDRHPFVRGGFAALFGPFGGQPDTIVTLDSVRTTVEWATGASVTPGMMRADTARTVHALRSHHTLPGRDGWVSLAVGYQYSAANRVDLRDDRGTLASTFPVSGLYVNTLFGPFPVWRVSHLAFWYAALGATVTQLSQANGTSDSTLVRFDTERALAPEASLLVGWRVHRGLRLMSGISAQHIRWSSIRYRTPSETPLPDAVLRRLPQGLKLTSVHFQLGLAFDASDLFGR